MGGLCSIFGWYETKSSRSRTFEELSLFKYDDSELEEIIINHRKNTTDDLLRIYYQKLVDLGSIDVRRYEQRVHKKIEEILQQCHEIDDRIPSVPSYVGSYPQGLKVGMPNEFDVNIQMNIKSLTGPFRKPYEDVNFRLRHSSSGNILWTDEPIKKNLEQYEVIKTRETLPPSALGFGYIGLQRYHNVTAVRELTFQGLLVPFAVKLRFYQVLQRVLKNSEHKSILISTAKEFHGPTITLDLGRLLVDLSIAVDLTPSVHLPFPHWSPWLTSVSAKQWLSGTLIENIVAKGVQLVAKKNYHWLISYNECEKELISHIDDDGGCRRMYQKIMKRLNYDCWSLRDEKGGPKLILSSYHLLNVWLHECERLPDKKYWGDEDIWLNLNRLINSLLTCLKNKTLTVYFERKINLVSNLSDEDLSKTIQNIEDFQQNVDVKLIHAIETGERNIIT